MIDHQVAIIQVNRLYKNYNPGVSQQQIEDKVQYLVEELKGFSDSEFIKVCDKIISESKNRTFPTVEDFKSRWHSVRDGQQVVNHKFCSRCEKTGYYTIWKQLGCDNRWYRFSYRCKCNTVTMQSLEVIDPLCVPARAHNPYPPGAVNGGSVIKNKPAGFVVRI